MFEATKLNVTLKTLYVIVLFLDLYQPYLYINA